MRTAETVTSIERGATCTVNHHPVGVEPSHPKYHRRFYQGRPVAAPVAVI